MCVRACVYVCVCLNQALTAARRTPFLFLGSHPDNVLCMYWNPFRCPSLVPPSPHRFPFPLLVTSPFPATHASLCVPLLPRLFQPEDKSAYRVVAKLGNAHPPSVQRLGDLGYLASTIRGNTYAAMIVIAGAVGPSSDRWGLAVVDVTTGNATVVPLEPRDVAGTWSMSGLGL